MRSFICAVTVLLVLAPSVSSGQQRTTLRGSKKAQEQQNIRANREDLTRIRNDDELREFVRNGLLVRLPENSNVVVDDRLDGQYRYCRPWTRDFLLEFGRAYRLAFPGAEPLAVTSAVRTVEYQDDLRRRNANAARTTGSRASAHLVGSTVDITKKRMSARQISWARNYLRRFKANGRGMVIEEFSQAVFHIMVFRPAQKKPAAKPKKGVKRAGR